MKSEFFLALNQVATERGISPDDVIDSIKMAVLAAYKKDYGVVTEAEDTKEAEEVEQDDGLEVTINKDTGETHILEDGKDITPPGFGRIAAQTARQVILQKIREAEKRNIVKHYTSQVGTIIKGRVIRFDGKNAYLDIGKAEGVLPQEEQIRNESYQLNTTLAVYIKEIKEDPFGNSKIIVSRADPKLVEELFKKEVPEVENGTVKVFKVVREPGERAKIAVLSDQTGVDPVGACVGQKGIRVKAVTDELGGSEKIDIIQWNSDDNIFLREALSPAIVGNIEIDKEKKYAKVFVNVDQAPLAIGKSGVNVNLASMLTNFNIDIVQEDNGDKIAPEAVQTVALAKTTELPTENKDKQIES
ncbi:transcription termination factor NusA [Candidatus Roizmanbacteria bacterium RIFCSPHIGHO2_02_FULL_37_13b]|uniref:Transcription termination/antitermination protein NusA n=1 Tax=Candidatus Roizmanbacteria bacterium RIFCSPLOWO2_02_FULL_36_11 TaxID=1802071 RepID=A0A1F7JBP8_9BACT|nr:MAG: transcription termination factor NusA [Candidatus Roizmanbacteria bacterium RIFCSPHIGHO2_02_FULL_37_13b]OGK53036.1 MAG: transcription termination factor NusA [Candidatus Roizmanbacteria bacterium RIFCSPLOWO2_02_FULL_36_11]